ncbi:MAG: hypothetical protein ABIH74_04095 [Candidatus Omnitrophota bacterium]
MPISFNYSRHELRKTILFFSIIFLFLIAVLTFVNTHDTEIIDEAIHLRTIGLFNGVFQESNFDLYYDTVSPFIPYSYWLIGKGGACGLPLYRVVTLLLSFFTLVIFYRILRHEKIAPAYLLTLLLLTQPYYLLLSVTLHWEMPGLFFGLISCKYFLNAPENRKNILWGSFFSMLAVWANSRFIFIPAGFILYTISRNLLSGGSRKTMIVKTFQEALPPFLSIASISLLFLYWGGIIPPGVQEQSPDFHSIVFNIRQIIFFLVFTGFYYFAFAIIKLNAHRKKLYLTVILLAIPFYFLGPIVYHPCFCCGIIPRIMHSLNGLASNFAGLGLFVSGVIVYTNVVSRLRWREILHNQSFFYLLSFILMMTVAQHVWERYYLISVPFILMFIHSNRQLPKVNGIYILWIACQLLLALGYVTYKVTTP